MIIKLPCSILLALVVTKLTLQTLGLPTDPGWSLPTLLVWTLLLYRRSLKEFVIISGITLLAEMQVRGVGVDLLNGDVLLALLFTVIVLPTGLDIMGIDHQLRRRPAM